MTTPRRVVILSSGDDLLAGLLSALAARGVRPHALVLYPAGVLQGWRTLGLARRLAALPLLPVRATVRRLRLRSRRGLRRQVEKLVVTGPLNSRAMVADLGRLQPDLLFLAFTGIVSPAVLAIPREGTVNVHPALLPWVRGNGAVDNSILLGVPLGCTAFWVDRGIDTGRLIARKLVHVEGGETREDLGRETRAVWREMAAEMVEAASRGALPEGTAQPAIFPLGHAVREAGRRTAVAEACERGVPRLLYERWKGCCGPDLRLPDELFLTPADGVPAAVRDAENRPVS